MLFGRRGSWQDDSDRERNGNEQTDRHTSPNLVLAPSVWRHSSQSKSAGHWYLWEARSLVHQEMAEESGNAGERILSRGRIRSLDPDNAGGGTKGQLAARQVGPVEMVIGSRIDLHLDLGATGDRAVKKDFARRRGNPDILGADQHQKWDGTRP